MTLNITVLSPRAIYQSGDFRLVDVRGQRPMVDHQAQKQILVTGFGWSAVVAFAGVGSFGSLVVADWLAKKTSEIPRDESGFDALIEVLVSADEWLARVRPLDLRRHSFSVGAFVGDQPDVRAGLQL